ncbi:hypothetical protein H3V53_06205 [Paraburkholderia bengalensis]|uniref:Lipoprotein n=1 Tax=Paraburkholderia bengalensis TaxID=2747562 RepID=A0ABU8IML5_9BURK
MKMKHVLTAAVLAAVALSGCANRQQRAMQQAYANKQTLLEKYVHDRFPLVNSGKISQSDYWKGFYYAAETDPVRPADLIMAKGANTMITAAQQLEAGKITREDFEAKRREVQIQEGQEMQTLKDQYAAQQAQQDQANRAALMNYYLQTRPVTTTCFGNTCTTR